jgi:hypothetical protein
VDSTGDGKGLNQNHQKVYSLIWRRAIASQMKPATYTDIHFEIQPDHACKQPYVFGGKSSILKDQGYLKIYTCAEKDSSEVVAQQLKNWESYLSHKHYVQPRCFDMQGDVARPKPLYNEATFVKTLESKGIGRPSTYASVVDKLYSKGYISKGTSIVPSAPIKVTSHTWVCETNTVSACEKSIDVVGKESNKMLPTSIGLRVVEYLSSVTPYLLDPEFTRLMESDLDKIVENSRGKKEVLDEFYKVFGKSIEKQPPQDNGDKGINGIKGDKKQKKGQFELKPGTDKVLKTFPDICASTSIIRTKYGPALFHNKTFYSISPLLEWKNKTVDTFDTRDARFVLMLPKPVHGSQTLQLAMGRYGLYVKDGSKNIRLHKDLWENAYNGTLTLKDIESNPVLEYEKTTKKYNSKSITRTKPKTKAKTKP